jgi:ABC-type transport system involved in multi-copper enzyme maturation permease subunit
VNAYIILTFFKTIWLTMVLGVIHGLLFIPVFLSFIPLGFFQIHGESAKSSRKSSKEEKGPERKMSVQNR